jgi:hypothetical protein
MILPMSVIIFFSASKNIVFCRNDVQAIDFLRKGSYAPAMDTSYTNVELTHVIINIYEEEFRQITF